MQPFKVYMWQNLMCVTYLVVFKRMEDFFKRNGCVIVDSAEEADLVIIGACGAFYYQIDDFFEKLDAFVKGTAKVAVYGCLPKVTPRRYSEAKRKVAQYIDTRHPEQIERLLAVCTVPWNDVPEQSGFRDVDYRHYDPEKRYLVVQEGCSATCVFCPHIRGIGPHRSVPLEKLISQVKGFINDGMRILLLEGRDIGSWGTDFNPPRTFADFLEALIETPGDFRIFINQLGGNWTVRYQKALTELLHHPKVADIHIPIQTVSDRLLELMGRERGISKLKPLLDSLGRQRTGRVLRTDMLIGFPTETEEEFEATLAFILEHFDEVACYGFELHPDTKVATMGLPLHSPEVIKSRVQRAIEAIRDTPGMVWHCGGQDPETMNDRETQKRLLNRS